MNNRFGSRCKLQFSSKCLAAKRCKTHTFTYFDADNRHVSELFWCVLLASSNKSLRVDFIASRLHPSIIITTVILYRWIITIMGRDRIGHRPIYWARNIIKLIHCRTFRRRVEHRTVKSNYRVVHHKPPTVASFQYYLDWRILIDFTIDGERNYLPHWKTQIKPSTKVAKSVGNFKKTDDLTADYIYLQRA